jgi:ABC-2 type transport system ATP-binding protein
MISVSRLVKRFRGFVALDGIRFQVNRGEAVGLLGPNGAGKTTTMRILAGALPATSGQVSVAGFDVFEKPLQVKRRVGYLPEVPPLYVDLDVTAFLVFVSRLKGLGKRKIRRELDRVIDLCGLEDVRQRRIGNLSKGFRQRIGLAMSLLGDPEVLILDEPTIGLDPNQIVQIRALIKTLAENHTVILSTHILPEVTQICDRVVIIHRGKIVADDSIEQLATEDRSLEQTFFQVTRDGEMT